MLRYAKKLTQSHEDAEDLVQITMVAAVASWSPEGGASFLTYAGNSMPRYRRDLYRKKRVSTVGFADIPVPEGLEFDASDDAQCAEEIEAKVFADQILSIATPTQKVVLAGQALGATLEEIAELMGITKQRVFAIGRAGRTKAQRVFEA